MGIFVQQVSAAQIGTSEANNVPKHIEGVLEVFLKRYNELQRLKQKEFVRLIVVLVLGFLCLWSMLFLATAELAVGLSSILVLGFIFSLKQYYQAYKETHHVYINVHILYHHLLGKIEVGFCQHQSPCQCAEAFKQYMWKRYGISFYGTSI